MDIGQALTKISGKTMDSNAVEVVDVPSNPLPQADYEAMMLCPYTRYRPSPPAATLSVKREANSPAGADISKKHRQADRPVPGSSTTIALVTLDGNEEVPGSRVQVGRIHSDPGPSSASFAGKTAAAADS